MNKLVDNAKKNYKIIRYNQQMHDRISIRVLAIYISTACDQQANTVDLIEYGGEREWILAEIEIAMIVGLDGQAGRFLKQHVSSRVLLIFGTKKSTRTSLVNVGAPV